MVLGAENTAMNTQAFYFLEDAPKTLNSPENKKPERLRRMSAFEDAQISSLFSTRRSISCFRARARQQIGAELCGDVPKTLLRRLLNYLISRTQNWRSMVWDKPRKVMPLELGR
jgi:hypothetical protein